VSSNYNVLCFVDKKAADGHPFIESALKKIVGSKSLQLVIFFSSDSYRSVLLSKDLVFKRRGLGRWLNFGLTIFRLLSWIKYGGKHKNIIFVRNEPIYLAAAVAVKTLLSPFSVNLEVVFQSSYPHERYSGSLIQRFLTRNLLKLSAALIDRCICVSDIGCQRLADLGMQRKNCFSIPLYCERIFPLRDGSSSRVADLKFVYVGSTESDRDLALILRAFARFVEKVPWASLSIYGSAVESEEPWISNFGYVPRDRLLTELRGYDFGLVYIPALPQFKECSPTKLGDYIATGVIPLGNREIHGIRSVIECFSQHRTLPSFTENSIYDDLCWSAERSFSEVKKLRAAMYSFGMNYFTYEGNSNFILAAVLGMEKQTLSAAEI
jgi:glycosyltransferase involved in cell wall biosynthesis